MKLPAAALALALAVGLAHVVPVEGHGHGLNAPRPGHGWNQRGYQRGHQRGHQPAHQRGGSELGHGLQSIHPLPPESAAREAAVLAAEHVLLPRANTTVAVPLPPSVVPTSAPSPVPTPLDLALSASLTSSCIVYLASLVSSSTFLACLPFSLLLTTSTAYSTLVAHAIASGNYTTLNELIAYTASPQPGMDKCESYMQGVASALAGKANCEADVSAQKPVAIETLVGVGNYRVMKEAEALVNPVSGCYCYLEAIAFERPDDLYLWGLPGGISLPATSKPSCSACSALLLNAYLTYTPTTSTLNATAINSAARRLNEACGAGFVNVSTAATTSWASSGKGAGVGVRFGTGGEGWWWVVVLGALAVGWREGLL